VGFCGAEIQGIYFGFSSLYKFVFRFSISLNSGLWGFVEWVFREVERRVELEYREMEIAYSSPFYEDRCGSRG